MTETPDECVLAASLQVSKLLLFETDDARGSGGNSAEELSEEDRASKLRAQEAIQACQVKAVFCSATASMREESLLYLLKAIIWAAGRPPSSRSASSGSSGAGGGGGLGAGVVSTEEEDTAVFCLDLMACTAVANWRRVPVFWPLLLEQLTQIISSASLPNPVVERAVDVLLYLCRVLMPPPPSPLDDLKPVSPDQYHPAGQAAIVDELLRSLHVVLRLDARLAEPLCERITNNVLLLVRHCRPSFSAAGSPVAWRTLAALLAITARHSEAAAPGFEALCLLMKPVEAASGGEEKEAKEGQTTAPPAAAPAGGAEPAPHSSDSVSCVTPLNFVFLMDAARDFAEARTGGPERSRRALDLLGGLMDQLLLWAEHREGDRIPAIVSPRQPLPGGPSRPFTLPVSAASGTVAVQDLADLWLRLAQALRRCCMDPREEVRQAALFWLQRCLLVADRLDMPATMWGPLFDQVVFVLLDDLHDLRLKEKPKDYRNVDASLRAAVRLLSKVFLHYLQTLAALPGPSFKALWLGVLHRMERFMRLGGTLRRSGGTGQGNAGEQLRECVEEAVKNLLMVALANGILVPDDGRDAESLWVLTWRVVRGMLPNLRPQDLVLQTEEGHESAEAIAAEGGAAQTQ